MATNSRELAYKPQNNSVLFVHNAFALVRIILGSCSLKAGCHRAHACVLTVFLALIDDLNADCLVHKYVDDTTLPEIVQRSAHSNIQDCFQQLLSWSEHDDMAVNFQKTRDGHGASFSGL